MINLKKEKGDAIIESLVAFLILGLISGGIVYGLAKTNTELRETNVQNLIVKKVKEDIQANGVFNGCPNSGSNETTINLELTNSKSVNNVSKICEIKSISVTKNGISKTSKVPIVNYKVDNKTEVKSGTMNIGN